MNAVMISIKPKWCELIANGNKTIEVRKTKPRYYTPFKCYIYCTMDNAPTHPKNYLWKEDKTGRLREIYWNGKVIGEFICNRIRPIMADSFIVRDDAESVLKGSCLSISQFKDYAGWKHSSDIWECKDLYAWHISDLVIYDEPKELDTFYRYCGDNPKCHNCDYGYSERTEEGSYYQCVSSYECCKPITRPPQSWCYVEDNE